MLWVTLYLVSPPAVFDIMGYYSALVLRTVLRRPPRCTAQTSLAGGACPRICQRDEPAGHRMCRRLCRVVGGRARGGEASQLALCRDAEWTGAGQPRRAPRVRSLPVRSLRQPADLLPGGQSVVTAASCFHGARTHRHLRARADVLHAVGGHAVWLEHELPDRRLCRPRHRRTPCRPGRRRVAVFETFGFWLVVFGFLVVQVQSARWGSEIGATRYLLPLGFGAGAVAPVRRLLTRPGVFAVTIIVLLVGTAVFVQHLTTGQWID